MKETIKNLLVVIFLLILLVLYALFYSGFLKDNGFYNWSTRIEKPSVELVEKLNQKYFDENFIDDFTVYGFIGNNNDCEVKIRNSQNIVVSGDYVFFNNEVNIPVESLFGKSESVIRDTYKKLKEKYLKDKRQRIVESELKLVK